MAETKYVYAISTGTLNGLVNSNALESEINASTITIAVSRIETAADVLDVYMKDALSAGEQTTLTQVVNAHPGVPLAQDPETVIVQEETIKTGGHIQYSSFELTIDFANSKNLLINFPFDINIFSIQWQNQSNMEDDRIKIMIDPDNVTGALDANVSIGDTVISVQQSVMDAVQIGYELDLDDGTNNNYMGAVVGINKVDNELTMENAASDAFLSSTPTNVWQTVHLVKQIYLRASGFQSIGGALKGGTFLPKNKNLRLRYTNNEGSTSNKVFSFIMEYKY